MKRGQGTRGSLSAVELVTVLYFSEMNVDPQNPKWADRDRFILSKVMHAQSGMRPWLAKAFSH